MSEKNYLFTVSNSSYGKVNEKLDESNKGHQLLRKMGWGGAGLGAKEQGIEAPISAGEVFTSLTFSDIIYVSHFELEILYNEIFRCEIELISIKESVST